MARERKIIVALGASGTGKSALVRRWIPPYRAAHGPESVRILDPSRTFIAEGGEWPGRKALKEWLVELTADGEGPAGGGWGPGMLVLDDADRWLRPWIQEEVVDLWTANRHLGLDIVITGHRPQSVPKEMIGSASELWLFAQEEPHAYDYLTSIRPVERALEASEVEWPEADGYALRVELRAARATLINTFDVPL